LFYRELKQSFLKQNQQTFSCLNAADVSMIKSFCYADSCREFSHYL